MSVVNPIAITLDPQYLSEFEALLHPLVELRNAGYVLDNLTPEEIEAKARCQVCGKFVKRYNKKFENRRPGPYGPQGWKSGILKPVKLVHDGSTAPGMGASASKDSINSSSTTFNSTQSKPTAKQPFPNGHPDADDAPPKLICKFHSGVIDRRARIWTCCKKALSEPPCCGEPEHTRINYASGQLEAQWQYFVTPEHAVLPATSQRRLAVAIDCEMGTALDGDSELIRVTVLDYSMGHVLVDRLVYPEVPMEHYNTKYSGVSRAMMETAKRNGTCLFGKAQARDAVWEFIAPETTVVGHSAVNDLKAMRWIHHRVVDSFLLEAKPVQEEDERTEGAKTNEPDSKDASNDGPANPGPKGPNSSATKAQGRFAPSGNSPMSQRGVAGVEGKKDDKAAPQKPKTPKGTGPRALKTLARIKLGREIQTAGNRGHDSIEDALAARDLVHWAILNRRALAAAEAEGATMSPNMYSNLLA